MFMPGLICKDGFRISIQAGEFFYSLPKNEQGPYTHVECGYPSSPEYSLKEYAENTEDLTETVYLYVPVDIVNMILKIHGGVAYFSEGPDFKISLEDYISNTFYK